MDNILGLIIGLLLLVAGFFMQDKNKNLMFLSILLYIPGVVLIAYNSFWINVAWHKFLSSF